MADLSGIWQWSMVVAAQTCPGTPAADALSNPRPGQSRTGAHRPSTRSGPALVSWRCRPQQASRTDRSS
uniref:Putative secreted peptide n=1 Tax=Anopheles braziliensis TaxID=58242 RepID=A0A2M3ZX32_9DIPT